MNATHELDRRLADFYAGEAPQRAPDRVLEGALATIDRTSQRRALVRVPWRIPTMDTAPQVSSRSMMTLPALLAITLVAVVLGGAAFVFTMARRWSGKAPGMGTRSTFDEYEEVEESTR